jgi:AcrR family transcriptional regulator
MNTEKRPYRMRARAAAAAETHRRILAAMRELAIERFLEEITLEDVAERAGVATRTVIRRFGGRERLVEATVAEAIDQVQARRDETPVGDVEDAVEAVFDDYEANGDALMMMLAQERRHPELLGPLADDGRRLHWQWIERVFTPRDRQQAAQLIAATDVYVWKLLRRDIGLSRARAKAAMAEMVARLT